MLHNAHWPLCRKQKCSLIFTDSLHNNKTSSDLKPLSKHPSPHPQHTQGETPATTMWSSITTEMDHGMLCRRGSCDAVCLLTCEGVIRWARRRMSWHASKTSGVTSEAESGASEIKDNKVQREQQETDLTPGSSSNLKQMCTYSTEGSRSLCVFVHLDS